MGKGRDLVRIILLIMVVASLVALVPLNSLIVTEALGAEPRMRGGGSTWHGNMGFGWILMIVVAAALIAFVIMVAFVLASG